MDVKKYLDFLFDQDFIDEEQNSYFIQKEALLRGIKFSPLNGSLINYHKSNQLADDENKSFYYLLQHIFFINNLPNIRNKLAKIIVFPEEIFQINVYYQNQLISSKTHQFTNEDSLKIKFQNLCEITQVESYDIKELCFEVKLNQLSLARLEAEENDCIYDSQSAINKYYNYLGQQLEVLQMMKKNRLLAERIKLWGFNDYNEQLLQLIGRPMFVCKNVYELGMISYSFLNEVSNDELFAKNEFHLSYLTKIAKLSEQLASQDILWVSI